MWIYLSTFPVRNLPYPEDCREDTDHYFWDSSALVSRASSLPSSNLSWHCLPLPLLLLSLLFTRENMGPGPSAPDHTTLWSWSTMGRNHTDTPINSTCTGKDCCIFKLTQWVRLKSVMYVQVNFILKILKQSISRTMKRVYLNLWPQNQCESADALSWCNDQPHSQRTWGPKAVCQGRQ